MPRQDTSIYSALVTYGVLVYIICLYVACFVKGAERESEFQNSNERKQIACYSASLVKKKEQLAQTTEPNSTGVLDTPGG
jgi:hypothetical protein